MKCTVLRNRIGVARLDLDVWINDPPSSSSDDSDEEQFEDEKVPNIFIRGDPEKENKKYEEPSEEVREQLREARRLEMENNPNYLKPDNNSKKNNETQSLVNNIETPNSTTIPGKASICDVIRIGLARFSIDCLQLRMRWDQGRIHGERGNGGNPPKIRRV